MPRPSRTAAQQQGSSGATFFRADDDGSRSEMSSLRSISSLPAADSQYDMELKGLLNPDAKYRIAVFSYGLPCPGEKRGGIEQVAHALANALANRGHDVTVFTY